MQRRDFVRMLDEQFALITEINRTKGHDYAGDDDALANFKQAGEKLGLTPEQVWGVYADKHWSAVMTFVKEGDVKSEPIEGRLHDVILYSFLLLGLIAEKKGYPRTLPWDQVRPQITEQEEMMIGSPDNLIVQRGLQAVTKRLGIDGITGFARS